MLERLLPAKSTFSEIYNLNCCTESTLTLEVSPLRIDLVEPPAKPYVNAYPK